MQQVLFEVPFPGIPGGIPIYGFGMMLFLAFVLCTWLASWRARQQGIAPERVHDLALWVFVLGIAGARITYLVTETEYDRPLSQIITAWAFQFFKIWDGGLVFYGSILGGVGGYLLAYRFILKKHGISSWKMADVLAPAIVLGLCLGRLGCFLNGCCYGHVNCIHGPAVEFPLSSPPRYALTKEGVQTAAGFALAEGAANERTVGVVDPASAAHASGLRPGDVIVKAGARDIQGYRDLSEYLVWDWPRGQKELQLTVQRHGQDVVIGPFEPRTVGLHPTQVYSSVGAFLIFLLLQAYYPLRRRDGAVMALLMLAYPVERFLEESLRSDNPALAFGLTFSQHVSVYLLLAGLALAAWLWRRPVQYPGAAVA